MFTPGPILSVAILIAMVVFPNPSPSGPTIDCDQLDRSLVRIGHEQLELQYSVQRYVDELNTIVDRQENGDDVSWFEAELAILKLEQTIVDHNVDMMVSEFAQFCN